MRLWILSDLHLRDRGEAFRVPEADVCVCAGDIGEGLGDTVRWLAERIGKRMPVVLVAGNHEFYGSSVAEQFLLARRVIAEGRGEGVHLLENESIIIAGTRFVGATLWTDYRARVGDKVGADADREVAWSMDVAERLLMDHATVRVGDGAHRRRWLPRDAAQAHARSRAFIEAELVVPFDGPTVVVTHHAPHPGAVSAQYAGSSLNPAFVSDMSDTILAGRPEAWVFGHVHSSHDYHVGDTRLLCNPRGYVQQGVVENPDFDPRRVVTVERRRDPVVAVDEAWLAPYRDEIAESVRETYGAATFRVLGHVPVLWSSWECDHGAVLVELPGGRREFVVLGATAHGGAVDLRERVREYRAMAVATEALLRLREKSRDGGDS